MAKRYYWLKLHSDFFDSVRIKKLRSIAGGDTFTIIYLKLLLHTIDSDGVVEYQGIEKSISEELALVLNEDSENVGLCLSYLRSVGLAEIRKDSVFLPEAVNSVGSETASAQRSREYRARQKVLHCNTTATQLQHECNTSATQMQLTCNVEKNVNREDIDKRREEINTEREDISNEISKRESSKRFVKPTVDDVQAYISENNFVVDAQKFIDYYESNGWVVGKTKMKDWKATVRGWERREQEKFRKTQKENGDPMGFLPF